MNKKNAPGPAERSKSELKRQKILDAAARVFRERGYAHGTLQEIAETAGTKAGSLYYHFHSREDLVEKVLELSMTKTSESVIAAVEALPPEASALERIETALRAHLRTILIENDYVYAYQKIINQVPPAIRERFSRFPRAYAKFWDGLIAAGRRSGALRGDLNPVLMRLLLLGSASWTLEWYKPDGPASPSEVADHLIALFLEGAAVKPPRMARPAGKMLSD